MNEELDLYSPNIIVGAKKGGNPPPPPIEEDDSLSSTQYVRLLDMVSEGEIWGIEGGANGIYLDKTSLNNFSDYTLTIKTGTQNQTYITDQKGTESTTSVGVGVTVAGGAVVKTITNSNVDRVSITIQIPTLQIIKDNGDIVGHSVQFTISVQYNGGGYSVVKTETITGKTSNSYSKSFTIGLSGAFPVDIKVTRLSADETSAKRQNLTNWHSYTTIIDEKFTYPNSAIVFMEMDAKNFSSVPARKYLVKGIKVKIPHNGTVDMSTYQGRITYSGVFNGTLGAATWCNDPAFILYDLLTSSRYGCDIDTSQLDVFDFYNISTYCNTLVSNGKGGNEPRFSCNCVINTRDEAYSVIQELTNVFRGMAFYGAGSLVVTQDKAADSQYIFSPANVIDGLFTYSGSSHRSRHTVCTVAWQSYDHLGEVKFERVEDQDAINQYGIIEKEVKGFGCWSQGQAQRLGRWILLSEKRLSQTITFGISIDAGIVLYPGMVISVADPMKGGSRRGGRISSATTTAITLDTAEDLTVDMSKSPKISVVMPDGSLEQKTISNVSSNVITVSSAFSEAPNSESVYIIETTDVKPLEYRVLSVTEEDGKALAVTALEYDETIYNEVDTETDIQAPGIPGFDDPPNAITEASGTQYYYESGVGLWLGYDLSWTHDRLRTWLYKVNYRIDNDNWTEISTVNPSAKLPEMRVGSLQTQITPYGLLGAKGPTYEYNATITEDTTAPENVTGLSISKINDTTGRLSWDPTTSLDVRVGGKVYIRHSNDTSGSATFDNSSDLVGAVAGISIEAIVPYLNGEYMVKFEDFTGNKSATEASLIVDDPVAPGLTLIYNRREDTDSPAFQGSKTNTIYYSPPNFTSNPITGLVLDGDTNFDSVTSVDDLVSFDFPTGVISSGEYAFDNVLDLGGTFTVLLDRHLVIQAFNYATGAASTENVNAVMYVATTTDDPASGGATWSSWTIVSSGYYTARGYKFKVALTTSSSITNIAVKEMGCKVYMGQETLFPFVSDTSGTSTKAVSFGSPFFAGVAATIGGVNAFPPAVAVNVYDLLSGEYSQVSSITGTGFNLDVKNSSNNHVNRSFTYQAIGLK